MSAFITFLLLIIPVLLTALVNYGRKNKYGSLSWLIGLFTFLGVCNYYLIIRKGGPADCKNVLVAFKSCTGLKNSLLSYFLYFLGVGVGLVLLIVPGVIFGLMFSQIFYILN